MNYSAVGRLIVNRDIYEFYSHCEKKYFRFSALLRQRVALSFAIQLENVERSVFTLSYLCLP